MDFIMFLLIAVSALFIGSVVIAILLGIGEFLYEKAYDYFYPRPALSEEEMTEVLNEAAQFVHSKQLPGENLDGFADYLDVSSQMINKRLKEKVK
jgi:hypothetical protein